MKFQAWIQVFNYIILPRYHCFQQWLSYFSYITWQRRTIKQLLTCDKQNYAMASQFTLQSLCISFFFWGENMPTCVSCENTPLSGITNLGRRWDSLLNIVWAHQMTLSNDCLFLCKGKKSAAQFISINTEVMSFTEMLFKCICH